MAVYFDGYRPMRIKYMSLKINQNCARIEDSKANKESKTNKKSSHTVMYCMTA